MAPFDHPHLKKFTLLLVALIFMACSGEKPEKKASANRAGAGRDAAGGDAGFW